MFLFRCRDMNTFPIETLFFDHNKKVRAVSPSNQNEFNNIQSCGRVACSLSLSPRASVVMQQQPFWADFKEFWVVNPLKQSFADRTTNSSSWWKRDGMLFALLSFKPMVYCLSNHCAVGMFEGGFPSFFPPWNRLQPFLGLPQRGSFIVKCCHHCCQQLLSLLQGDHQTQY